MHLRILAAAVLAAAGLLGAAAGGLAPEPSAVADTETALELHVSGLAAHSAGDRDGAAVRFEEACRLRHEPSCQAVWLQLDLGALEPDDGARARLDLAANRLAEASGGTWFPHADEDGYLVRIYCPVEREADLRVALERLRAHLGG
jgi:hypothetical protein